MKCFKIKKYRLGDFSFIENEIERKSMEFDYRVYNRIKVKSEKKENVISKMNYSDESYINKYFHFNPPTYTVPCDKFAFAISDKGGIGETRYPTLDIEQHKKDIQNNKNKIFDIVNNIIIYA
jgi:hypothetical protein